VCEKHEVDSLVMLGEYAGVEGRLDHTFGIINSLCHLAKKDVPHMVVGQQSYMCALGKGEHVLPVTSKDDTIRCGVIPILGPTKCTTKGLKWNLQNQEMRFLGRTSTSNMLDSEGNDEVYLSCSDTVLWVSTYSV